MSIQQQQAKRLTRQIEGWVNEMIQVTAIDEWGNALARLLVDWANNYGIIFTKESLDAVQYWMAREQDLALQERELAEGRRFHAAIQEAAKAEAEEQGIETESGTVHFECDLHTGDFVLWDVSDVDDQQQSAVDHRAHYNALAHNKKGDRRFQYSVDNADHYLLNEHGIWEAVVYDKNNGRVRRIVYAVYSDAGGLLGRVVLNYYKYSTFSKDLQTYRRWLEVYGEHAQRRAIQQAAGQQSFVNVYWPRSAESVPPAAGERADGSDAEVRAIVEGIVEKELIALARRQSGNVRVKVYERRAEQVLDAIEARGPGPQRILDMTREISPSHTTRGYVTYNNFKAAILDEVADQGEAAIFSLLLFLTGLGAAAALEVRWVQRAAGSVVRIGRSAGRQAVHLSSDAIKRIRRALRKRRKSISDTRMLRIIDKYIERRLREARRIWRGCFPAGTLVATEKRLAPIESIRTGDRVWAFDLREGAWKLATVAQPLTRLYRGEMFEIKIPGETIRATANHPFWVIAGQDLDHRAVPDHAFAEVLDSAISGRWIEAQHLRPGDVLLQRDGLQASINVVSSQVEQLAVYNLHVWGLRSFAVAEAGILVHNSGGRWAAQARKGGRYGKVRTANVGGDVHHMPADSVSPFSRDDGPAIWMETADHVKTTSFAGDRKARIHRELQRQLIEKGRLRDAIQMDIDDIHSRFGDKYDDAIRQMLDSLD